MNRRQFLQKPATSGLAAGLAVTFPPQFGAQEEINVPPPQNGHAVPDDGWTLWIDRSAQWQDDVIYLPEDVNLSNLPVNPPSGGWQVLHEPANPELFRKIVTLPATVEQHFWGNSAHAPMPTASMSTKKMTLCHRTVLT